MKSTHKQTHKSARSKHQFLKLGKFVRLDFLYSSIQQVTHHHHILFAKKRRRATRKAEAHHTLVAQRMMMGDLSIVQVTGNCVFLASLKIIFFSNVHS